MIAGLIAITCYAILIIVVGIIGSQRTKSFNDFLLGGGKIGAWMSAFSYGTAYFSAVLFIGFAGKIGWGFGLSGLWIALGNAFIGVLLTWAVLGNKIKEYAVTHQIQTMPEFLEVRYGSPFLKLFTSIAIFIFFIPYTAAVFMGLSYLFTSNFHIDYTYILIFMGVFTGIYLVLGGYKSMAMIDLCFGIIMLVGVGTLFLNCLSKGGGFANIINQLNQKNPGLTALVGPPGIIPLLSLVILTGVAPLGMPQLVQKFYAIRDRRAVRVGMIASTIFALLISGVAYFAGALTRIFISPEQNPAAFKTMSNGVIAPNYDALMPELLTKVISPSLTIIILLLILAASMSTLASLVLISSSSVTKDLYAGFINKKASDKTLTTMVRILSICFILLSMVLAYFEPSIIVTILAISWGAIASMFLGPFLWGLFYPGISKFGGIFAAVGGLGTCIILFILLGESKVPTAGAIGMVTSLVLPPIGTFIGRMFISKR